MLLLLLLLVEAHATDETRESAGAFGRHPCRCHAVCSAREMPNRPASPIACRSRGCSCAVGLWVVEREARKESE